MADDARIDRTDLRPLKELGDFKVASGYPDIRGWHVKTREGRRFGKVSDLIVSPAEMRARYIDVDLDNEGHALIPIGIATLDGKHDDVLVHELSFSDLAAYPRYDRKLGIERSYESAVWRHFSPDRDGDGIPDARQGLGTGAAATAGAVGAGAAGAALGTTASEFGYDSERYDDRRMLEDYRNRSASAAPADATAVNATRSADLPVTERSRGLSESFTATSGSGAAVRHEEVTIEMRPIAGGESRSADIQISENEIRIPLMSEMADGRRMPQQEVIVRKRMVEGAGAGMSAGMTAGTGAGMAAGSGMGTGVHREGSATDRMADRADDLKDRVDGNPASRPGRDMTDRPAR